MCFSADNNLEKNYHVLYLGIISLQDGNKWGEIEFPGAELPY